MTDQPRSNWDNLLGELGSPETPDAPKPPAERKPPVEPDTTVEPAATTEPEPPVEASPQAATPAPKTSAWDSLANELGVECKEAPSSPAPEKLAPRKPAPPKKRAPRKRASSPPSPRAEASPPAADTPTPSAPPSVAPSAPATKSPEPAAKGSGGSLSFKGWFPFAARRPKSDAVDPSVGGEPTPSEELPAELFTSAQDDVTETSVESVLPADEALRSQSAQRDASDAEDASEEERPKRRRRRRGGRGRRRKSTDATESPVEGVDSEQLADTESSLLSPEEASEEKQSEEESRPRRRRGRGRGRGRKAPSEEKLGDDTERLDELSDASDEQDLETSSEVRKVSHKDVTPWEVAIGVVVDANIAARSSRPSAAQGTGRGGRSRGGRRRRGGGNGGGGRSLS